ncbi:MAG: XdhC family protein [Rhodocyclales bacterium]|nr:XdhC family protein [Rhodocyclales bacterium]
MDSTDLSVLNAAIEWLGAGRRTVLATVVETWGSSPRPVGAWLAIRDDGQVVGSVSGGCVEDDLIARLRSGELTGDVPELLTYGVTREQAARFGLPCGGRVRLVIEPAPEAGLLEELRTRIHHKRLTVRELDTCSGRSVLRDATRGETFFFDGRIMRTLYGPRWRLIVIGAGQLSQYVCEMALAADYEVVVIDPREEFAEGVTNPAITFRRDMPDDAILDLAVDTHTAIVALTHDPKLDDLALLEALKSPAFYVGALGSRTNSAKRRERLALFDLTAEEIDRLHGPVGLFIGARSPAEMAVSILAEITAAKYGVPIVQKRALAERDRAERHTLLDRMSTACRT